MIPRVFRSTDGNQLHAQAVRLAVLPDFPEECWPSMDLCAEMLLKHLPGAVANQLSITRYCPSYARRFTRLPGLGKSSRARNVDRLYNRFWNYPRALRRARESFDFFHLCDHSYSHLLHHIPAGSAGVFCHDLDTFRCLLEPARDPRPRWFRSMVRRILTGFQKAAIVFCCSQAVRREIEGYSLFDPSRLIEAPNGVAEEFSANADSSLPPIDVARSPFVLHVGSCIARKRIDVLLDVFAGLSAIAPELRLLQVGGEWSDDQKAHIDRLKLGGRVTQVRGVSRQELAATYRRATLVLQPSEAEGFGLPVAEALACGAPVIASDLPVLREVGGSVVAYAPVGDVAAWVDISAAMLSDPCRLTSPEDRKRWARRYSWAAQAKTIGDAYVWMASGNRHGKAKLSTG